MSDRPDTEKPKRRSRRERLDNADTPQAAQSEVAAPSLLRQPQSGVPDLASGGRPGFNYLSVERIELLRERTFELLEKHGIAVAHDGAVKKLQAAGATQSSDGKRLMLPRKLVEESLAATPRTTTLCGKLPQYDIELPRDDNTFTMRTGTGAHGFIDAGTGEYRKLGIEDIKTMAKVCNGLDAIGIIAHPFVSGVAERTADVHALAAMITHTPKHAWIQPYDAENVEYLMRVTALAAGGEDNLRNRPIASCIMTSFSPLEYKAMDVEVAIQCSKYGVPIHACSLPTAGGTSPVTMPATILMAAAEILGMVTLIHVMGGTSLPVIATPLIFALDMRTGRSLQSSPEVMGGASMAIQLMKQGFGMMTHTYGAGSDTPVPDAQSMAERALLGHLVGLAGADVLGGVGQVECATVFSPLQAVLDDELGQMLKKYMRTPEIDDESLAWDLMMNVDVGGHFLANEHTLKHCRSNFTPQAFARISRDVWQESGKRDAMANARDICAELMMRPVYEGLPEADAVAEINEIVKAADANIAS